MVTRVRTVDAHVGGQTLRLIVEGLPRPVGRTMIRKRDWLRTHADAIRCALVHEPRGHADMVAAVLTEPVSPDAHAGLLFMDAEGYPVVSGHGLIAAATIAAARDLIVVPDADADQRLAFETLAGVIHTLVRSDGRPGERRIHSVAFRNVPSFVHTAGHPVRLHARELRVDVAFGGLFYAIVDTEAVGIPLRAERLPDLRRLGIELQAALNHASEFSHPIDGGASGIAGVVFTGPPSDPEAHLRSVVVSGTVVDRIAGGHGHGRGDGRTRRHGPAGR